MDCKDLVARNILIGMALLLCCCSTSAAQTAGCVAIPDAARISEVGAFSNMRYTDEHAYGYSALLWRAGDCLFGFFESSQGLAGDTPMGELQDLKYDSKTGHLSFSAKLTTGVVSFKGSNGLEPSRDLFAFDGNLKGNTVTGVIIYTLQNNPNFKSTRTNVVLGTSKAEAELMHGSTTHGEWLRKWQPILQRRGPKW
jgi:hypothetical protein